MEKNVNTTVAIIGAIIGFVAIIPVEFLSWWKSTITFLGSTSAQYIDAFGNYVAGSSTSSLGGGYAVAGIVTIVGAILLLLAGLKLGKTVAILGSLAIIAGPIIFLIAHGSNSDLSTIISWIGSDNVFFGTTSNILGEITWYLNVGFFLAIGGGIVGLLSTKSSK